MTDYSCRGMGGWAGGTRSFAAAQDDKGARSVGREERGVVKVPGWGTRSFAAAQDDKSGWITGASR